MAFDWLRFCDSNGIVHGRLHVSRGQISVHCPWCGPADETQHLSINLEGKGFRCWRNPREHSGRNPARLVAALLKIPYDAACAITGTRTTPAGDDFLAMVEDMLDAPPMGTTKARQPPSKRLVVPDEFEPFLIDSNRAGPFIDYMVRRGFSKGWVINESCEYGIRFCRRGPYKFRVILLIHFDGHLVTWTGRTIGDAELRYKTHTPDRDKARQEGYPPAAGPITDYLWDYDRLVDADANVLVLTEGPFDAIRVRYLGEREGIAATCCFTASPSPLQIDLLHELAPKFKRRILLLDENTAPLALSVERDLIALDIRARPMLAGFKDPGELRTTEQLLETIDD